MTSIATARKKLRKQGTGDNVNTWGVEQNEDVLDRIDEALGVSAVTVSGNVALTNTNFESNQARVIYQVFAGTGGTVTIPSVDQWYAVKNNASGAITITAGATAATLPAGAFAFIRCDGMDVFADVPTNMLGARLANLAEPAANADAVTKLYVDTALLDAAAGNLPGQTGNAGKFLTTNGTIAGWADPLPERMIGSVLSSNGVTAAFERDDAQYITAPVVATSRRRPYYCDTSGGSFTLTLPASPSEGDRVAVITEGAEINNLTIGRNGSIIMGLAEDLIVDLADFSKTFFFINGGWRA